MHVFMRDGIDSSGICLLVEIELVVVDLAATDASRVFPALLFNPGHCIYRVIEVAEKMLK